MRNILLLSLGIFLTASSFSQESKTGMAHVFEYGRFEPKEYEYEMNQITRKYSNGRSANETSYCVYSKGELRYEFVVLRDNDNYETDFFFSRYGGERKSSCVQDQKVRLENVRSKNTSRDEMGPKSYMRIFGATKYEIALNQDGFNKIYVYFSEGELLKFRFFD